MPPMKGSASSATSAAYFLLPSSRSSSPCSPPDSHPASWYWSAPSTPSNDSPPKVGNRSCVNKTKPSTPSQCGSDSGTTCQPHWDPLHRRGGTRDWYHRRPCRTERHPARPSAPSCAAGHLHRWFGRRLGHSCRRCVEGRPHRGIQRLEVPTQPRGRNGVGGTNLFLTNNWVAVLLASSGFCGGQH
jgi:hypothetical protein